MGEANPTQRGADTASRITLTGLVVGPLAMLGWLAASWSGQLNDWPPEANRLFAILLLTGIWWLTEPIPLAATGMLAVILGVVLRVHPGPNPAKDLLAAFADPVVFFLIGGLYLAAAMTRHGLDRRFALWTLSRGWVARHPTNVLLALGLTAGSLSMWISNTASTAMLFPVALGMIRVLGGGPDSEFSRTRYATAMLLMVSYASTIGGLSTPIGTMPNLVVIGVLDKELAIDMPFLTWMMVGVPLSLVVFGMLLLFLSFWKPDRPIDLARLGESVAEQRRGLGAMKRGEFNTLAVFLFVVTLWVLPSVFQLALGAEHEISIAVDQRLPKAVVAMMAPVLLFLLPVDNVRGRSTLEPEDFRRIDWGTILLFGSGLAVGAMIKSTGLGQIAGEALLQGSATSNVWVLTAITTAGTVLLTDIMSNTATAVMIIPMVIAMCESVGLPALWPAMGAAFGSSFGSCLPVSTPPNAIVYGSGLIPIRRMVSAGLVVDLMGAALIWVTLRAASAAGWLAVEAAHLVTGVATAAAP